MSSVFFTCLFVTICPASFFFFFLSQYVQRLFYVSVCHNMSSVFFYFVTVCPASYFILSQYVQRLFYLSQHVPLCPSMSHYVPLCPASFSPTHDFVFILSLLFDFCKESAKIFIALCKIPEKKILAKWKRDI